MKFRKADLKPDERATLELRGLYEQFGYKKYKMSRFEEYSLYIENKDFLGSDKVISFTDLDGRLLALKPDVTLSIIKNTRASRQKSEKLYYIENVYRESKECHTYKEINQMGLEFIGDVDRYGVAEVLALAVKSLKAISPDYILEISHMSFVVELLKSLETTEQVRHKILRMIRAKNTSGIQKTAVEAKLTGETTEMLCRIPSLYGDVSKTLKEASKLALNETMNRAMLELKEIYEALKAVGCSKNVQVDFSMVNDIDYYNGIIFRGYVKELSRPVLAGGQYDTAMKMFGKEAGAVGFALYLNEINRIGMEKPEFDVDVLVLYDENADLPGLMEQIEELQKDGLSVYAAKNSPKGLRHRSTYRYSEGILEECVPEENKKKKTKKEAVS